MRPRVLVLRSAGTNCDLETAHAFELAGADAVRVHVNRLLESPKELEDAQILALPGGFSHGDDIAAGRILASQLSHHLKEPLARFVDAGKPVLGICNGFQVLVKTDLLPGPLAGHSGQTCTLTHNDHGRFLDAWVHLTPKSKRCIWTENLGPFELPIAHGEGRFVCRDESVRRALWDQDQVALVYTNGISSAENESDSAVPGLTRGNPNGSTDAIAGVCDASGLVFGLMPHPERYVDPTQHFAWTGQIPRPSEGKGLIIFRNAVEHARSGVGAGR